MYAVACSKMWEPNLIPRLKALTGHDFYLITSKDQLTLSHLKQKNISTVFFPHWSHLIGEDIFNNIECIIFHMTDLPFGRGGSPLQNLIVRGHKKTKISALRCEKGLDTGPIYLKEDLDLSGSASEIFLRATWTIEKMIATIIETKPIPRPQEGEVSEFKRRGPADGDLVAACELSMIYDYIRMLDAPGYPPAFLETPTARFEFSSAVLKEGEVEAKVRIIKK